MEERVVEQYRHREELVSAFFDREADRLSQACFEMARRFHRGGRILAFGFGAAATDAQHISVEFVHPVIVGKRALPAIAIPNDGPTMLGLTGVDPASAFSRHLAALGRSQDIAIGLSLASDDPGADAVAAGLKEAKAQGMLTIGLQGPGDALASAEPDWLCRCDDRDPFVVQEVHETLYHVLWETVHVFFDHRGILEQETGGSRHDVGDSSFLYPFLDASEGNLDDVLREVRGSILRKAADVVDVRREQMERPGELVDAARFVAERVADGGKILTFGNGGSATDAQDFVTDLMWPPPGLRPVPALALTNEEGVVTAVGNDVGYDKVFLRQIISYGDPADVAFAFSTSGSSRNIVAAFEEARRRGLGTVACVGYGGGKTVELGLADHALVSSVDYIPRIQEGHATQYHVLRRLLEDLLDGRGG